MLILVSGVPITGKSTIIKFLKLYLKSINVLGRKGLIKLLSTDSVREHLKKYIHEKEELIFRCPSYMCDIITDIFTGFL